MFRATMCQSSGEITVSIHLVLVTLYGMQGDPAYHTIQRNTPTKKNWAPSWLYLQDYTGMHGQQNIKNPDTLSLGPTSEQTRKAQTSCTISAEDSGNLH